MKHAVIDLETLSTSKRAVVMSIGLAWFDDSDRNINSWRVNVELLPQFMAGFVADEKTCAWWLPQSTCAKDALLSPPPVDPIAAWSEFYDRLDALQPAAIWGNGPSFDNAICAEHIRYWMPDIEWPRRLDRCLRTLKALVQARGLAPKSIDTLGLHRHICEDDAILEASQIMAWMDQLSGIADRWGAAKTDMFGQIYTLSGEEGEK